MSAISSLSMFGFFITIINSNTVNLGRLVSRASSSCLEGLPDPDVLNSFSSSQMFSSSNPNSRATVLKSPFFCSFGPFVQSLPDFFVSVYNERDLSAFKGDRTVRNIEMK